MDTLYSFYFKGVTPVIYFMDVLRGIYNFVTRNSFSDKVKIEEIYDNSLPLAAFPDGSDEVMNISKKEFLQLWISVMLIAGTVGPKHLLETAMGRSTIPLYKEGVDTSKIKPTEIWDKIDLDDKGEIMAYILECGKCTVMMTWQYEYSDTHIFFHPMTQPAYFSAINHNL